MRALEYQAINLRNAAVAYLLAVSLSSLVFTFLLEGTAIVSSGGFESSTTNSFLTKAGHLSLMTVLFLLIGWIFSFVTALVPYTIAVVIARYFKVTHWSYFVFGAAITAVAISPLYISIPNLGINVQEHEPTFREQFFRGLPYFVVSGSSAGWACWRHLRQYFSPSCS
jgi:hypothetical protein